MTARGTAGGGAIRREHSPLLEETRQQGYTVFPCSMYIADADQQPENTPFYTKPHWHSAIEILHFERGEFQLMINMENYHIEEECFAIVESGMLHAIHSECGYHESALLFHPSVLSTRSIDAAESSLIAPLLGGVLSLPRLIRLEQEALFHPFKEIYEQIHHIFMRAQDRREDQFNVSGSTDQLKVKALMMLLIAELSEKNSLHVSPESPNPKVEALKSVLTFVNEHYMDKIYLKELSGLMNMNEQYFSRFFKKAIGKTPIEYINEVRVRHAAELLTDTDQPILDIAIDSGFGNMGHFIEVFKRATGMKPLEFRTHRRT